MPLTKTGAKVLRKMKKEYGKDGESIFYATMKKRGLKSKQEKKTKDDGMQAGDVKICQRPFRKKLKPIEGLPSKNSNDITWEVIAIIPFEGKLPNADSTKDN